MGGGSVGGPGEVTDGQGSDWDQGEVMSGWWECVETGRGDEWVVGVCWDRER